MAVDTVTAGIETDPGRQPRTRNGRTRAGRTRDGQGLDRAHRWHVLLYLLPALLLVTVFLAIPLAVVFGMSTTEWAGVGTPQWVGVDNFVHLAGDEAFRKALVNTLLWVLVGTFIHTPLCVLVALVIARRPRGWKIFRTVFFLPNVISATALALMWYFVFHVSLGLLNSGLKAV